MDFKELEKAFDDLQVRQAEMIKKFREEAAEIFKQSVRVLFNSSPDLQLITWTQYTPYFNDGEECVFSVNSPTFSNATGDDVHDIEYGEYDGDNPDVWAVEDVKHVLTSSYAGYADLRRVLSQAQLNVKMMSKFAEIIQSSWMEDCMKSSFGDHVKVSIDRALNISIEEYDHD